LLSLWHETPSPVKPYGLGLEISSDLDHQLLQAGVERQNCHQKAKIDPGDMQIETL
jgi:hypothetical protein